MHLLYPVYFLNWNACMTCKLLLPFPIELYKTQLILLLLQQHYNIRKKKKTKWTIKNQVKSNHGKQHLLLWMYFNIQPPKVGKLMSVCEGENTIPPNIESITQEYDTYSSCCGDSGLKIDMQRSLQVWKMLLKDEANPWSKVTKSLLCHGSPLVSYQGYNGH